MNKRVIKERSEAAHMPSVKVARAPRSNTHARKRGGASKSTSAPTGALPSLATPAMAAPMSPREIVMDGEAGRAAMIGNNVPLPGSHTGRRVLRLDLGIPAEGWQDDAKTAGQDPEVVVGIIGSGARTYDSDKADRFFEDRMIGSGRGHVAERGGEDDKEMSPGRSGLLNANAFRRASELAARRKYKDGLDKGIVIVPQKTWDGRTTTTEVPLKIKPAPGFFLIEVYGVSSFLGEYGLGRTVRTFSLMPGEETTITLRTWRSSKATIADASSIVDSHNAMSSARFADSVQSETTDKSTKSSSRAWSVEAEAEGSWGVGSASASAQASGESHSSREEFSRQLQSATTEHASQASSARESSVTSSSEQSVEEGEELKTERKIKNVNMRRLLNFVFRELNQEYLVKFHLKDVRIAFSNNRLNSWREVPLSGLRGLLSEYLVSGRVDDAAKRVLQQVAIVFDRTDTPVSFIEKVELADDGLSWSRSEAMPSDNKSYPAPTERRFYRVRRGQLSQDGEDFPVEGVLLRESKISMRTDSVFVEAVLGAADALDEYAMHSQAAEVAAKYFQNQKLQVALTTLAEIEDPEKRAQAYAVMLNPPVPASPSI